MLKFLRASAGFPLCFQALRHYFTDVIFQKKDINEHALLLLNQKDTEITQKKYRGATEVVTEKHWWLTALKLQLRVLIDNDTKWGWLLRVLKRFWEAIRVFRTFSNEGTKNSFLLLNIRNSDIEIILFLIIDYVIENVHVESCIYSDIRWSYFCSTKKNIKPYIWR